MPWDKIFDLAMQYGFATCVGVYVVYSFCSGWYYKKNSVNKDELAQSTETAKSADSTSVTSAAEKAVIKDPLEQFEIVTIVGDAMFSYLAPALALGSIVIGIFLFYSQYLRKQ